MKFDAESNIAEKQQSTHRRNVLFSTFLYLTYMVYKGGLTNDLSFREVISEKSNVDLSHN